MAPDVAFYDELTVEENLASSRACPVGPRARPRARRAFELRPSGSSQRFFGMAAPARVLALLGRPWCAARRAVSKLDAAGESVARALLADHLGTDRRWSPAPPRSNSRCRDASPPGSLRPRRSSPRRALRAAHSFGLAAVALFASPHWWWEPRAGPVGAAAAEGAGRDAGVLWDRAAVRGAAEIAARLAREREPHATPCGWRRLPRPLRGSSHSMRPAAAIDALVAPRFWCCQARVPPPPSWPWALIAAGYGLAAGTTLIAAIVAQTAVRAVFAVSRSDLCRCCCGDRAHTRAVEGSPPDGVSGRSCCTTGLDGGPVPAFPAVWHAEQAMSPRTARVAAAAERAIRRDLGARSTCPPEGPAPLRTPASDPDRARPQPMPASNAHAAPRRRDLAWLGSCGWRGCGVLATAHRRRPSAARLDSPPFTRRLAFARERCSDPRRLPRGTGRGDGNPVLVERAELSLPTDTAGAAAVRSAGPYTYGAAVVVAACGSVVHVRVRAQARSAAAGGRAAGWPSRPPVSSRRASPPATCRCWRCTSPCPPCCGRSRRAQDWENAKAPRLLFAALASLYLHRVRRPSAMPPTRSRRLWHTASGGSGWAERRGSRR